MDERRRVSQRQERRTAKRLGAKLHPGSGSGPYRRNDSHTDDLLIENKTTVGRGRQITLKASDLEALRGRAYTESRMPVLQIDLGGRSYYVIPEADFEDHRGTPDREGR